jgi:hypothetical protein
MRGERRGGYCLIRFQRVSQKWWWEISGWMMGIRQNEGGNRSRGGLSGRTLLSGLGNGSENAGRMGSWSGKLSRISMVGRDDWGRKI